jgi:hypothetical protein
MADDDQISTIDAREKEIADQMAALQKELEELATAKRVLLRLSGHAGDQPVSKASKGKPRPSDIPTNFEMVEFILGSAEKDGKDGLAASELVDSIRARYWPGLSGEQILPSIYAFAKNGRLRKTPGGKFKRIKRNQGSAEDS